MAHTGSLYDQDFAAWAEQQAAALRLLREGARPNVLDFDNLIEEVEDLARSERREVRSRLRQVLVHLLMLRHHPDADPRRGWGDKIAEQRVALAGIFATSPSLRAERLALAAPEWGAARRLTLDRLERYGQRDLARVVAQATADEPYFNLDTEVLAEGWYPPPPASD